MKTTLTEFIKSSSIPASLIRAVIWQIGDWQTFQEYAPDISKHGIDAGFPGFTYYNQTEPFAKAQKVPSQSSLHRRLKSLDMILFLQWFAILDA